MSSQQPDFKDERERLSAIGVTAGSPPVLKCTQKYQQWKRDCPPFLSKLLDPASFFGPLPVPNPGDWLDRFPEPGQTFSQFLSSRDYPVTARKNVIHLQPFGSMQASRFSPPGFLELLAEFARSFYQLPVALMPPADLDSLPQGSYRTTGHWSKRQYLTSSITSQLRRAIPEDSYAAVAVTMADLYPGKDWNFVFGEASPARRVGVFSFARTDPEFYDDGPGRIPAGEHFEAAQATFAIECAKTLVHELGHLCGFEHCVFYRCLMNGANHGQESAEAPELMCPCCLRKLHLLIGFDFETRYRQLADILHRFRSPLAGWASSRIPLCH